MTLFKIGFIPITLIDVIDIIAVAFIFYQLFLLVKGTRAAQMLMGLMLIFLLSLVARNPWRKMNALSWLLSSVQTVMAFAIIILFQSEFRRLLIRLGQSRLIRLFYRGEKSRVLDEVVSAARILSERGYGALIVLGREMELESIIEIGTPIKADVSADLIVTIFTPRSPLHDMAVILHGDMLIAAKCQLPLSQNPEAVQSMGTRHRAALGLSEESDAVIVIVSEETQKISIAVDGQMETDLTPERLKIRLTELFEVRKHPGRFPTLRPILSR
ncbi:MAG: TIGR00159 family protein [Candidatus Latescibacteria bacterium]|nr:TIGR00159 family protein [Candidatus Latescibacterota bacterium]